MSAPQASSVPVQAAANPAVASSGPISRTTQASWLQGNGPVYVWFALLILMSGLLVVALRFTGRKFIPLLAQASNGDSQSSTFSSAKQTEAEGLLQRAAANDSAAADQIFEQSETWIGKTQRTPKANGLIAGVLNSHEMHTRESGVQAELAMDGIPSNEEGFDRVKRSLTVPRQRAWALWTLGALGNRGVETGQATDLIASYLSDPDAKVRQAAVVGLSVLGSDETVSKLLDRFRNDNSPMVQEEAACALAEAGLYTHEQRMVAANSLLNWLDDSTLSSAQRIWILHALSDIAGQNLGNDSSAWRRWYENSR